MLMTCLMRTMRQKGFFRQMDIIPQALSRPSRSLLPVIPAESPFLSFPQFLAGIHGQNSLSRGVNRESYPFGKASTTSEW